MCAAVRLVSVADRTVLGARVSPEELNNGHHLVAYGVGLRQETTAELTLDVRAVSRQR